MKKIRQIPQKQSGYILFVIMLLIGSLGLYLTYQFGAQKIKTQSWQIQKTTTEITYWADIEKNYIADNNITTQDGLNGVQLNNIMSNNYLPYGQGQPVTFQSAGMTQVSEFLCSPLPGINSNEAPLTLSGNNFTCPLSGGAVGYQPQHCALDTQAYYSCGSNTSLAKAQYYANANYIGLGNTSNVLAGLGLIIRTPGAANSYVQYSGGQMGTLPNNSTAQTLMSLLPTSAFNVYSTPTAEVSGIGIGTYLYQNSPDTNTTPVIKNSRYSKIIDMGSVQAVDLTNPECCGWNGNVKGKAAPYNSGGNKGNNNKCKSNSKSKNSTDPPNCIQINRDLFGPNGTVEQCSRIDVLYAMIDNYQPPKSPWYIDYTKDRLTSTSANSYSQVFLSARSYTNKDINKPTYLENYGDYKKNRFAYIVRCTRASP
jgi:hypothetical protein